MSARDIMLKAIKTLVLVNHNREDQNRSSSRERKYPAEPATIVESSGISNPIAHKVKSRRIREAISIQNKGVLAKENSSV